MILKHGTIVVCLTIILLSGISGCKKENENQISEDYAISESKQPLSDRDITACLNALGLRYTRFSCLLPQKTGVTFSSIEYIKGQERGGNTSGTMYLDKGKQDFILFMEEADNRVKFKLASSTGSSVGCGSTSTEGCQAKTWGWLQAKKLTQEKQPVFLYAANNEGIEGFPTPLNDDIEKVIEKYDFAIVIYASIADKE